MNVRKQKLTVQEAQEMKQAFEFMKSLMKEE